MNKKIFAVVVAMIALLVIVWASRPKTKASTALPAAAPAASVQAAKDLYSQAAKSKASNDLLTAQKYYQEIITKYPDADNIVAVQKDMEATSMQLLFSRVAVPGKTMMYEVAAGDSLVKVAKKFGTTVEFVRRCNNLRGDTIHLGQKLRVWTSKFSILVDKSQNKLYLKDGNDVIKIYSVSTGANNSTPIGTYKITSKLENPVWFNKGAVIPPESPDNVLGSRWMGFDLAGYGIHGTTAPDKIGQQVTAGCVRMRNAEVEELFSIIPMGTEVTIVD